MKTINIYLEDTEYDAVTRIKGVKTWKQLIMGLVKNE